MNYAVVAVTLAADVLLLLAMLAVGAAKGFTLAEVWRVALGATRRFWAGHRDWSRHGDEDREGKKG